MFEQYTEKARRVIFFARYEASLFGSPTIDTEHLLLGLAREEKRFFTWVPKARPEFIRQQVESWAPRRPTISTAVDMPLSSASGQVLFHAKDEADRLNSKYIGTEHLLLGLLQEQACPAAKLLTELGASVANLRETFEQRGRRSEGARVEDLSIATRGRRAPRETVEIHGTRWYLDYVYDRIRRCREHRWHWSKESWKSQDCVREKASGLISLNLSLAQDTENFELIKRGWSKDFCAICRWEFFESSDDHGTGYTNGRDWLCLECYEKFWRRPDFISGSYSEIT